MTNLKRILTRDVTPEECPWLDGTFKKGEIVYHCVAYTYGCISEGEEACTLDPEGNYPFFELPSDALQEVE